MKTVPDFPKAIYGCDGCLSLGVIEANSHPPEELVMITNLPQGWDSGWYCEGCSDEASYQYPDSQIGETLEHYLGMERDRLKALNAELLAALKYATKTMEDYGWDLANMDAEGKESYRFVIDAIAKAEGRD